MIRARSTALLYKGSGEANYPGGLGLLKVDDRSVRRVKKRYLSVSVPAVGPRRKSCGTHDEHSR